ncbi:MAG: hypothetical protein ACP5JU_02920 [Minisyncoccia bacterium]
MNKRNYLLSILMLIIFYVIVFKDSIIYNNLLTGVDFSFPTKNFIFESSGLYSPWMPVAFGVKQIPTTAYYGSLINILSSILSFGNYSLAQKLMLASIPVASVTMFLLIKFGLKFDTIPSLVGAILYAYGPIPAHNFGTGGVWELAFFPLVILFLIFLIEKRNMFRNSVLLALSMTMMFGFGQHLIIYIIFIFVIFLIIFGYFNKYKMKDFIKIIFWIIISFIFYFLMNFYVLISIVQIFGFFKNLPHSQILIYTNYINLYHFYANYSHYNIISILSLYDWVPWSNLEILGFVISITSLFFLFYPHWFKYKSGSYVLSFLIILLLNVIFILSISYKVFPLYLVLNILPIFKVFEDSIGPTDLINFLIPILMAFTIDIYSDKLSDILKNFIKINKNNKIISKIFNINHKQLISIILSVIIIFSYFIYVPIYKPIYQSYSEGYSYPDNYIHSIPQDYYSLMMWLNDQEKNETFRYLVLPLPQQLIEFFNGMLPYTTEPVPIESIQSKFMSDAITYLINNKTKNWGSIIGLASIKYIIVPFNVSSPKIAQWYVEGDPKFHPEIGLATGSPHIYYSLLLNQSDLKLIKITKDYALFENLDFKPIVQSYSSAAYISGDFASLSVFTNVFNNTLLINPENNISSLERIFSNYNLTDYILDNYNFSNQIEINLHSGGGWLYENYFNNTLPWNYWSKVNPYYYLENNFMVSTGPATIQYNLTNISKFTNYVIFAKILFSEESNGMFDISIENKTFISPKMDGFTTNPCLSWIKIGELETNSSNISIKINNLKGFTAINKIKLVPIKDLFTTINKLENFNINSSYYFTSYPYISKNYFLTPVYGENFNNTFSWGRGNPNSTVHIYNYNNSLTIEAQGTPSNPNYQIVASYLPRPYYELKNNQILKFSIKSSYPSISLIIFGYNNTNSIIGFGKTITIIPNVWQNVSFPLNGYPEKAAYIDFCSGKPGSNVTFLIKNLQIYNINGQIFNCSVDYLHNQIYNIGAISLDNNKFTYKISINERTLNNSLSSNGSGTIVKLGNNTKISIITNNTKIEFLGIYIKILNNMSILSSKELTYKTDLDLSYFNVSMGNNSKTYLFISETFDKNWVLKGAKYIHVNAEEFGNGFIIDNNTFNKNIVIYYDDLFIGSILIMNITFFIFFIIISILTSFPFFNRILKNFNILLVIKLKGGIKK